jgi:hypothetical protein
VGERHGRLSIAVADGIEVDVARVLSGDVSADQAGRLRSGELLAGLAFDDEPGFDNWLLLQRSRVGAAVAETHAWAASALAHTDPEAALDLLGLATRADPFNDRPGAARGRPGEVRRRRLLGRAGDGPAGGVERGRSGDAILGARALICRGMCESDRYDYRSAQAMIELGLRILPEAEVWSPTASSRSTKGPSSPGPSRHPPAATRRPAWRTRHDAAMTGRRGPPHLSMLLGGRSAALTMRPPGAVARAGTGRRAGRLRHLHPRAGHR